MASSASPGAKRFLHIFAVTLLVILTGVGIGYYLLSGKAADHLARQAAKPQITMGEEVTNEMVEDGGTPLTAPNNPEAGAAVVPPAATPDENSFVIDTNN